MEEVEGQVSAKVNGVAHSMLKEGYLDPGNNTVEKTDITREEGVGRADSPPPDTEAGLEDVNLNQSQTMASEGGGSVSNSGEDSTQDHSKEIPETRIVDPPRNTDSEGDATLSQQNGDEVGEATRVSFHAESQSSPDHSELNTGESNGGHSHNANAESSSERIEGSDTGNAEDQRGETSPHAESPEGNPHAETPGSGAATTDPSPEELPANEAANSPPIAAGSTELLESKPSATTATSGDSSSSQEIPIATPAVRGAENHDRTESQTSFVNEYALSAGKESPTYEVDRNLEQFSEILLDSDVSDAEVQVVGGSEDSSAKRKKAAKKVRFADEVANLGGSRQGHSSPPPPPSSLPTHPSPEPSSKHPGVPITPSPTSPKNKAPCPRFTVDELINGVELPAEYLGSTPIILDGLGAMKSARMFQAQQAVQLIKDPESESRPHFAVKLKISTGSIRIADNNTDVDLMEHPLHTITYVADIDHVLVIMAHIRPPLPPNPAPHHTTGAGTNGATEGEAKYIPKMTCHVLDSSNAREAAMVIGQAFSAAYKQFLRSSGISDQHLEQAEYAHILNAQSVPRLEVESLGDRNKIKKLTLAKHKNDIMGMMVMESGYGSAIPACVIVHLSKTGSASKCGLLNIGDHILSINGVNLVGMPRKACLEQIKGFAESLQQKLSQTISTVKCRYTNVVKMEVCSCPTVVEVTIVRPDLKYQLGFSIHEGTICSLVRGSIAERSGVRVGHRIIDINGTSTVGMQHSDVVHLLSSTVGDLHIRMMPDVLYKLLTGKLQPECY